MEGDSSDIILFFGRFHPLILHLPIGFLVIAFLLEIFSRFPGFLPLRQSVGFVLILGSASAAIAALLGLMLARGGGYQETLLAYHQWTGIGLAVISVMALVLHRQASRQPSRKMDLTYLATMWMMVLLLAVTGHFGGSLTHGSDYLTRYMPDGLRRLAGLEPQEPVGRPLITDLNQALLYNDIIHPILDDYCTSCHNDEKRKGDLMMHTPEHLLKGGESGPSFISGDAANSDMIKRILLPEDHDDHMPREGKRQVSDDDLKLLIWWINEGAPFEKKVAEVDKDGKIMEVLEKLADPQAQKSASERLLDSAIAPVSDVVLASFRKKGVAVSPLSSESHWLQADVAPGLSGDSLVEAFNPVEEQITWLNLSGTSASDSALFSLANFRHLTRLHLGNTAITDEGLSHLKRLHYLESLNLYGTKISDSGLAHLKGLPGLRRLYLWQTRVTEEGVSSLKDAMPHLEIIMGEEVE